MTDNLYSVGKALENLASKSIFGNKKWAELAVSVNSTLLESFEKMDLVEPVLVINSNKYRDIFQFIVLKLFIKEKEIKYLLQESILQKPVVKQNPELEIFLTNEFVLKQFLINMVQMKGYNYLFSIVNFKSTKNNQKSLIDLIRIKQHRPGTNKSLIPEKRRIGVGYRDKGSLPLIGSKEYKEANTSKSLQSMIEENRQKNLDTQFFISGFFE